MIGGMTRIRLTVATLGADKKLLKLILLRSLVEDNILDGVVFRTLRTIDISGNLLFFRRVVSILSKTATQTVIIHPLNISSMESEFRSITSSVRHSRLRCDIFHIGQANRGNKWTFEILKPLQINHLENFQTSGPLVLSVNDITAMASGNLSFHLISNVSNCVYQ
jgi:hypothetical protein